MIKLNDVFLKSLNKDQYKYMNENVLEFYNDKKYSITDLEFIVINGNVSLRSLVFTQTLDAYFCKKYILNTDKYCSNDMDEYISLELILKHQNHLQLEDFN